MKRERGSFLKGAHLVRSDGWQELHEYDYDSHHGMKSSTMQVRRLYLENVVTT